MTNRREKRKVAHLQEFQKEQYQNQARKFPKIKGHKSADIKDPTK